MFFLLYEVYIPIKDIPIIKNIIPIIKKLLHIICAPDDSKLIIYSGNSGSILEKSKSGTRAMKKPNKLDRRVAIDRFSVQA